MEFRKKKYLCIGIFAVMCVYLLLQFHYVKVYFDDYGYYSLSYGVNSVKSGHNFNFTELISYLKIHYFDVNGRIPGYFVWLGLYILGGLSAVQTVAAGFVLLILVLLWKFIDNQKFPTISALPQGIITLQGLSPSAYERQILNERNRCVEFFSD